VRQTARDDDIAELLRSAVGHGLAGAAPWPLEPLGPEVFGQLLKEAMSEGIVGALAEAVADGVLLLASDQFEELADHHAASQAHMLRLERMLLRVVAALADESIDVRVLKGLALAHLAYSDPAWRTAADVDLLVPSSRFDDAVRVVIDRLGGEQPVPELRPGFDREFGKESMVRVEQVEVDLHRTFVIGAFGLTIDLDELFEEGTEMTIGGTTLTALGPEHQFAHACYNVALGDLPVRLRAVRDLLLIADRLAVDVDRAVAIVQRWRGTAVLARAGQLVVEAVGPGVAGRVGDLAALHVPKRESLMMRSYLTPARSYSRPLASLAVIPGVRPRLRYARALAVPSAAYLTSRNWTGRGHISRALGSMSRRG
jgi:hypothetical protein